MVLTRSLRQRALAGVLALSALLAGGWSRAQDCPPPLTPPSAEQIADLTRQASPDRGFLWSLERDGRTSHLYGTLHLGKLAWTVPGPKLSRALRASKVLALELDISDPQVVQSLLAQIRETGASPLPERLQQRLRAAAAAECVPWDQVADQRPEFQLTAVTLALARREGLEAAYGSEVALTGIAPHLGLRTRSLETADEQIAALSASTPDEQVKLIEAGLEDLASVKARRVVRQLADSWADSDLQRLESYADWCDCLDTPAERALAERVVDQRNRVLAERIDALHAREGRSFAAVGALHMIGPNGLPALLKARGFTVKRVF
ncbi:TraB/GumN family protein [Ottowia sp. GY511]|uniref:TraB/GumN family protein n=1 Tax=Ottowia flava TaxID=2675430 RepID=A0ABW4KX84_9BURK|nr:TraB/GumN family protein [Ottowia sp. GY511]TXK23299.1 TraB/GumN family protein [Ottowia sp. GY511]